MEMTGKIPATVVTGFLGAGKTTLIRHLIEHVRDRRLALVINEFGELALDGELLRDCGNPLCDDGDIVELANGCICCTVADDFLPTMQALLDRREPPDHIVIETSGLALPKPLVQAFNWPEVRTRTTVDGVVAVLDGPAVARGQFADDPDMVARQRAADDGLDHESPLHELYEDQLACADLVLLNKSDLMDAEEIERVSADIRGSLRTGVGLIRTAHGRIGADVLLGLAAAAEDDLAVRPGHHDDSDDHDHDEFESMVLDLPDVGTPEEIAGRLREMAADHGILRAKGFVHVAGKDMRLVVQGVGARIGYHYDRPWRPQEARRSRLVVIGMAGLDRASVAAALGC